MNRHGPYPLSRSRRSYQSCQGTSLIETVVTMSVASTLFLLATAWIHQSFFIASKMRDQGRHHDNLMRLSRQFRDDVHSASSVDVVNESNLRLLMPTGSIAYEFKDAQVSRSTNPNNDDSLTSRETFSLLEGANVNWDLDDRWLTMTVARTRGHRSPNKVSSKQIPSKQSLSELTRPSDLHVRAHLGSCLEQLQIAEASQ